MKTPFSQRHKSRRFSWRRAMPYIAVAGVAGIGTVLLVVSHAATLTGCGAYTYKLTSSTNTTTAPTCVNYIEKILNGAYQANYSGFQGYADNYTAAAPAVAKFSGFLADSSNPAYSAHFNTQFANRLAAFQEFFAYSGQDLTVDQTLTAGSSTVEAICGIAQHMPNPDTSHVWEADAAGAATHFGCGTITTAPVVSSRIKPTVGSLTLTCNSDGTGTVSAIKFGSPYGATSGVLTISYAQTTATTISYSTSSASYTPQVVVEGSSKVDAGAWKAMLVVTGSWNGHPVVSSATASSVACKKPATTTAGSGGSSTSSGGSTTGDTGSSGCDPTDPTCSGDSSGCDPSDPTCSDSSSSCDPTDPTCAGDSFGTDFGNSFNCDPSDPTCSNSSGDSGSTGCSDSSCNNSGSGGAASSTNTTTHSSKASTSSKSTKASSKVSHVIQKVRSILSDLF